MEKTLISTVITNDPNRYKGTFQAAWRVTVNGATGLVFHSFEWDKRDIMSETLCAEPTISGYIEEAISECGAPDPSSCGFCDTGERRDDQTALMNETKQKATVIVYEN